jgi:hypothetical protein
MSYPYDAPATNMSGYWSDGAYTPGNTVAYIKDDVTPINKNAMVNSVGKELSLIQNFVNKTYIGRENDYVGNSYLTNIHTDHLIGSGYTGPSNVGFIRLCSQLIPENDNTLHLGEFRSGLAKKFRSIAATFGNFVAISGYANPGGGGTVYTGGNVRLDCDIRPITDDTLSLGTPSFRFGAVVTSGVMAEYGVIKYMTSPDWVSTANPQFINLCSHLRPTNSTLSIFLGTSDERFSRIYTDTLYIWNPPTSAAGNEVWVDATGYLRIG